RAMRHAQLMGCRDPLMWRLVPALVSQMGQAFPDLVRAEGLITETLKLEEGRFKKTLDRGLKLLDEETANLGDGGVLDGEAAFKLYDTFGFPLDLTEDALREKGMRVDTDTFNAAMERQRDEARKAWSGSGDAATETVWFEILEQLGATEFLGYETEQAEGQITAMVSDGARVDAVATGADSAIVVNQTPFYGESGGQVGDTGVITSADGAVFTVTDVQKKVNGVFVHLGRVEKGKFKTGDEVRLDVDGKRRSNVRANHSATHLLHAALRNLLGDHVTQKGSLVDSDRLRFDISHPKALEPGELLKAEDAVNREIAGNNAVVTRLMEPDAAVEAGAMALFGEKYGDEVRVVSMGGEGEQSFSTELCGGTHVRRTGDIGIFKVISEGAVASGVRRIEALTGDGAREYFAQTEHALGEAAALLKVQPADVPGRVKALMEERKALEADLTAARREMATGGGNGGGAAEARDVGGVAYLPRLLDGMPAKELKSLADDLKKQVGSGVVALVSVADGKASVVVGVTEDLSGTISAVDLVKAGSHALGGKGGGGRPDMAQAGGPDGAKAQAALDAIEGAIAP
ncbi:MAG: alanine--tRNA ligase, partial [Alphaproteobacteria bacterium]|nr:alanine--tRNA ligase [Alphaproteobacteria bacterium]